MKRGEIGGVIPSPKAAVESMLQGVSFGRVLRCLLALGPFHGEAQVKGPSVTNPSPSAHLAPFTKGRGDASLLCSLVRVRVFKGLTSFVDICDRHSAKTEKQIPHPATILL